MPAPESSHRNPLPSDRVLPGLISGPLRAFLAAEASGGIVLLAATVAALVWANSPVADSYESLWSAELRLPLGDLGLPRDVRHWINEGLMTFFFFVVSLEIKRELETGELSDRRKALVPVVAAVGGMVVPALVYVVFNPDGPAAPGWGIPMATDIAFAVGVLALLTHRVPTGLKVFLLSLAIVDDIGAILVIGLFYSGGLSVLWLFAAAFLLMLLALFKKLGVVWIPVYVLVGIALWLVTLQSGVHATIAGVAVGLLAPGRAGEFGPKYVEVSVAERVAHLLHPWTSYLVIPLFALANAGIELSLEGIGNALSTNLAIGIVGGLVVGKVVGITGTTWLAVRLRLGRLPDGVNWRHILGAASLAGMGFTVSLFIAALAFDDFQLVAEAKIGVLFASLLAGLAGAFVLVAGHRRGS
jgi:Na+:H+ antiporter, NhaA family